MLVTGGVGCEEPKRVEGAKRLENLLVSPPDVGPVGKDGVGDKPGAKETLLRGGAPKGKLLGAALLTGDDGVEEPKRLPNLFRSPPDIEPVGEEGTGHAMGPTVAGFGRVLIVVGCDEDAVPNRLDSRLPSPGVLVRLDAIPA